MRILLFPLALLAIGFAAPASPATPISPPVRALVEAGTSPTPVRHYRRHGPRWSYYYGPRYRVARPYGWRDYDGTPFSRPPYTFGWGYDPGNNGGGPYYNRRRLPPSSGAREGF
ncbi:hypothetical protein [Alsobacter sp. R-9]